MMIAQKLYEGVDESGGLITYMRTDGVTVSQEAIQQTRGVIGKRFGDQYVPDKPRMYKTKAKNAQEAHEAIRPTDVTRTPESVAKILDKDQRALYDLIWKRMMASQMKPAVLEQMAVEMQSEDKYAIMRANGSVVVFDGFMALYNEGKDDEEEEGSRKLPPIKEGEQFTANDVTPEQHFTEPPHANTLKPAW